MFFPKTPKRLSTCLNGLLLTALSLTAPSGFAQPVVDTYSDTWVASDALGRTQPGLDEVGPVKKDKWVGIFYWTWHHPFKGGPNDNTKLIAAANGGPVAWPRNGTPNHWGEPELGYYRMTDPFVIRKHASMLSDAGVDVVLFDTTNSPWTWKAEYEALCKEYTAMRAAGNRTPSIGFITPFWSPTEVMDLLWEDLYKPGLWKDLWFMWDGKPFILADKEKLTNPEQLEFFTFRRPMPDYWTGPSGPDQWSWLEVFPQNAYKNSAGEVEQVSVGVAQNALPDTPGPAPMSHKMGAMGRSWHNGAKDTREGAVDLGLNFEEQWKRAVELDPKFVFVTGWNEWTAACFPEWSNFKGSDSYLPDGVFVDQYDHEYSRDCEPMVGGHTDNYYYQLASWIRRFKGVRPLPQVEATSSVAIDGKFDDWNGVSPEFRDTIGDVTHRDFPGYGELVYRNETGRNDLTTMKATCDDDSLYFYAETSSPITPSTDANWMLLLLDTDQDGSTGWLGYDFVVNQEVADETTTTVKRWENGAWVKVDDAVFQVSGNQMELALSRTAVGMADGTPHFDFHWADNIQEFGNVSELGLHGDSAPNRRWNYRFAMKASGK